ncbi:MAG: AmmeMemoRadiSam system radical SAM enzyme [Nitrospirota bacterium]
MENSREARFWQQAKDAKQVKCQLCPRGCSLDDGERSFCGVRQNVSGRLHTLNYGRSVHAAVETIETEAVFHFRPGARILSLGNIGCMLKCSYCQNWETSQIVNLNQKNVREYSSERVVEMSLAHGINILSWTYNDPVVWQEFVVDTARLASSHGIKNLYKSAAYINENPFLELCDVMDVFSISLKSMSNDFYLKNTKGSLLPVLNAIKAAHASGKHLEISNLLVTDLNDSEEDCRNVARWVFDTVGPEVPLHYVRFHPAWQYNRVPRTPVERLMRARDIAREEGIVYCYIGNLYEAGVSDTHCPSCGNLLVERFGLTVHASGADNESRCKRCGRDVPIKDLFGGKKPGAESGVVKAYPNKKVFHWDKEYNGLHLVTPENEHEFAEIMVTHKPAGDSESIRLGQGIYRASISKSRPDETGVDISWGAKTDVKIFGLLDRAHYPVEFEGDL